MHTEPQAIAPVTEDDIADFLANTPDFFQRHAELLAQVQLSSPHGNRAVSLQERQAEMLREKIRVLEQRVIEMIRHGNDNMVISDKLHRWAQTLFLVAQPAALPERIVEELRLQFMVPQVALKVWDVSPEFAGASWTLGVSDDTRTFASSLTAPYCGANSGFECVGWLSEPAMAVSTALIPLKAAALSSPAPAFGMLVLASPDPQRFHAGMGTDFLERIAELASAALSRLRPA